MAYDRVIGNVGLQIRTASVLGSTAIYVDNFDASNGTNISGKLDVHENYASQWDQLVGILQYCGIGINTPEMAQSWYKNQTPVTFINAIRKYLEEVFFPKLIQWLNPMITGAAPSVGGTLVDLGPGFSYILANMTINYGADGKITGITI